MTDTTAGTLKRDVTVIGLVSGGHFMSHYFSTMLPPLFPFLHSDLGVSYTLLGLLLSAKNLTSGTMQLPAGILVDKYGAKSLLIAGFAIMTLCYFIFSIATNFWVMAAFILLAGCGNAVFHPADYSILNGSISESRIGRSFSAHTFSGNLGDALAPVVILTAATIWNWRVGILISCVVSVGLLLAMLTQWKRLEEGDAKAAAKKKAEEPKAAEVQTTDQAVAAAESEAEMTTWQTVKQVMLSPPMLFLFLFFALQQLGSGGFRNWAVAGLVELHQTPVAIAGGALTGFLFASAFGVLAGGVVADKNSRHDFVAGGALLLTAVLAVIVGSFDLSTVVLVCVFSLAGWGQGMIRPARDMMIRAASPKGSIGKAFGFVFSGQAIGGTIAPVVFGAMIDMGAPAWVFYSSAVFMVICMLAVLGSAWQARKIAAAGQ
jgi:FSR family fosmidomycin resistance protein-like MFS transporter